LAAESISGLGGLFQLGLEAAELLLGEGGTVGNGFGVGREPAVEFLEAGFGLDEGGLGLLEGAVDAFGVTA